MNKIEDLSLLLETLSNELTANNLWQIEPIDETALASTMPFAVDTMLFQQWLQFVFIEKMQQVIAQPHPQLPKAQILPIATLSFEEQGIVAPNVLKIIAKIDKVLS